MLFKDQAQHIVARWECLREETDIKVIAAQTAVALSHVPDVPEDVLKSLDGLLGYGNKDRGRRIYEVVSYLRGLVEDRFRLEALKKE